jgi:hypothetical protein
MMTDTEVLRETQAAARKITAADSELALPENQELKAAVAALFGSAGETVMN